MCAAALTRIPTYIRLSPSLLAPFPPPPPHEKANTSIQQQLEILVHDYPFRATGGEKRADMCVRDNMKRRGDGLG